MQFVGEAIADHYSPAGIGKAGHGGTDDSDHDDHDDHDASTGHVCARANTSKNAGADALRSTMTDKPTLPDAGKKLRKPRRRLPKVHGTITAYSGVPPCHCQLCRDAWAAYMRRYRQYGTYKKVPLMKPPTLPPGFYLKQFVPKLVWERRDQWRDPERAMDYYLGLPDVDDVDNLTGVGVTLVIKDAYNPEQQSFPTRIFTDPFDAGFTHQYHAIAWAVMDIWQHELWEFMQVEGKPLFDMHPVDRDVRDMPFKVTLREGVTFDEWR